MLPERRSSPWCASAPRRWRPTLTVDPKAVEQQFEAKKDSYGKPETRSLVEIPLNDPAQGGRGRRSAWPRARTRPPSPSRSASTRSPTPTSRRSAIADRKAADGGVRDAGRPGQRPGAGRLQDRRPQGDQGHAGAGRRPRRGARRRSRRDLRQAAGVDKVYDLSQKFDDLRQGGAELADAAAKARR